MKKPPTSSQDFDNRLVEKSVEPVDMEPIATFWVGREYMRLTASEKKLVELLRMRTRVNIEANPCTTLSEAKDRFCNVWTPETLNEEFWVLGFLAPFVVVTHKVSGKRGSLQYQHFPRFYFNFEEE